MIIFLAIVVIGIIVLFSNVDTGSQSTAANTNQTTIITKVIPPIGKKLSWDSTEDICFALGSFIVGLGASGWIGIYENCTLTFNIQNFTKTYNRIHEKVPSDIIKFLAENPSILTKETIGNQIFYEIEFKRSFPNDISKTGGNISSAIANTLSIVQSSLEQGAQKTIEITGTGKNLTLRTENPPHTYSKTLWIN